jgi:hypothetical protein
VTYTEEIYLRQSLSDFGVSTGETGLRYKQDFFIGDGSTTAFVLSRVAASSIIFVYINTILQFSGFILSGNLEFTTIIFSIAPPNSSIVICIYEF